jgi:glycine cleavage system H lipoate-binding protein
VSEGGEPRAPDAAEALLGWRVWDLRDDGLLHPVIGGADPWEPGANQAVCHRRGPRPHAAPGGNCGCGFNALHHPPLEYLDDSSFALGVIAAWGTVDVFRTGFRAEYACVLGLLDSDPGDPERGAVAAHYGVPLLEREALEAHARRFAAPAAGVLLPGARRQPLAGEAGRRSSALPAAALAAGFRGQGVGVDTHLAVAHDGRLMKLGPTPSLAALAGGRVELRAAAGRRVEAGETLFVARAGPARVPVPAPLAGTVVAERERVPIFEEGPAGEGWLLELRLEPEGFDHLPIAWGRRGAEAYREQVLAARSDADLLLRVANNPAPEQALLDPEEARGWLRAFAQQLDAAIAADTDLRWALASLGRSVAFELEGVEDLVIAPPQGGEGRGRWVRAGALGEGCALRVAVGHDALQRYWRGELGLGRDDVAPAGVPGPAPLRLRAGDRGGFVLARSLHQRLFPRAAAILDGLGDPWFKAGDAIRDPVRNLRVLAGFQPPDLAAA